jgi:hypothetical protein
MRGILRGWVVVGLMLRQWSRRLIARLPTIHGLWAAIVAHVPPIFAVWLGVGVGVGV